MPTDARARAAAANSHKQKQKTAIREPAAQFLRESGEFHRLRLHVGVHIAEIDDLTDGVLIGPALASQRLADDCNMR
jgi:hypothetical protein